MDRAEVRHNFLALGLDHSLFLVGMSFASQATILPAFAAHLGASNLLVGAIPALLTLGWFLPSLFAAHHTERLAWKLPFVLRYTVWERLPMLGMAAVAFFLAEPAPPFALAAFFVLIVIMTGTGGVLMPAWMDIVGRAIPTTLRGRFFAAANLVASTAGLLGSVLTAWLLASFAPPRSYALCFLVGFVFLAISYVALAATRESAGPLLPEKVPLGSYLRRMPALLRRDPNFSWFLVARGLGTLGMMANGFYTVYALRAWQAAEWQVGLFTTLFLAGQVTGNLGLGWLADRAGHRLVLVLGVGALAAGNVLALQAVSPETLGPVFVLSGIHFAAIHVSARTIVLELAGGEGERPTYVGLANTALAPLNFVGPLAAGLMADRLGFPAVFGLAAAFGAAGVGLLLARVREPRWAGQRAT